MSMLERTFDPQRAMDVLKDPSVWPHVSLGLEDFNLDQAIEDRNNVVLMNDHGGFMFIKQPNYVYDVHTMFRPQGRGKAAYLAALDAAFYMFTQTDCLAISTFVTHDNPAARNLTLKVGFLEIGDIEVMGHPGKRYLFTLKDWARRLPCQQQS